MDDLRHGIAAAKGFRRGPVLLLIAGAVISFLPLPSRTLILALGAAWLGMQILGGQTASDRPADPVA